MFDSEGRLRLLRVEISEGPLQQSGAIRRNDPAASAGKIGLLESAKSFRSADNRTKFFATQEIIVDPLPANAPGRADCVVFLRIEQIDIISLLQIFQRKHLSCQEFVQKPQTPDIFAGRPGADIIKDFLRRYPPKNA